MLIERRTAASRFLQALVLLLVTFGFGAARADDAKSPRVERVRLAGGDFGYPSPFGYVRGPGMMQASYLFDTLLWVDSTGKPIPWLAEKWEHSADGKEWRFTLRKGIRWQDGQPLTADDVAFTFDYMTKGPGKKAPVIHARGLGRMVKEVVAQGPRKVVFRLKKPFAPFQQEIAASLLILPKHIWAKVDDPIKLRGPEALMGSGPYKLEAFDEAQGSYLYTANDDYFLGPPYIKRLEFVPAPDPMLALQRGAIDAGELLEQATPEAELRVLGKTFRRLDGRGNWNLALHFNEEKGFPYNDKRFRQAIAYAIDREDMVNRLLLGRGEPGSLGGLAPGHPFEASDLPAYRHDVTKARALLDELGIKDSNGDGVRELPDGKPFEQELQASTRFTPKSAELIKEYLRDVGIDVRIKLQDRASADGAAKKGNYTMALIGYGGIMGDPDFLRRRFSSKSNDHSFSRAHGYKNPGFDKLADEQLTTIDPEKRKELVVKMQELLADDVPVISLYVPTRIAFFNANVFDGWYYTPGCSPCRATRNKHVFVTGKKTGL